MWGEISRGFVERDWGMLFGDFLANFVLLPIIVVLTPFVIAWPFL